MFSKQEIERRYRNIRAAMQAEHLDALIASGSEYTGFEGAVRYLSDFEIVHRYCYVVVPLEGEPVLLFPREARWIGDKKKSWVTQHEWAEIPGQWIRDKAEASRWKKIGVFGLDFIMPVRDYRALAAGSLEIVGFDRQF